MARRLKRGELYYVKPPGFVGKVRPAVVVQADRFNEDPPANGLEKPSQVMIDKIVTLPLERFDNPIGAVSKAEIDAIAGSLRTWLDL